MTASPAIFKTKDEPAATGASIGPFFGDSPAG
jgi:hypothetical protein